MHQRLASSTAYTQYFLFKQGLLLIKHSAKSL